MADERDGIVVEILANVKGLITGMQESASAVTGATAEMEGALEGLESVATAVLGPFAAIFALVEGVEMFGGAIHSTVEMAHQLTVLHEKTGIAVESLSALQYAATRSEVSAETLTIGFQRLARAAESAAAGDGKAASSFQALGITATDAHGRLRPMDELLLDIATKFQAMPDGTTKAALAMDLFGRSGANLIPLLNRGRDGIAELEKEARDLGVTMGEKDVAAALEYEESMKKLHAVWDAFVRNIVVAALPVLEKLVQTMQALVHAVSAAFHILMATAAFMTGDFYQAASQATAAWEDLKKVITDFNEVKPAQAAGEGAVAPIIPVKDKGPTQLEKWREELNGILEAAIQNGDDLEQVELDFWKAKLEIAEKGSKDYIEIHTKIVELEKAINTKHVEAEKKLVHDIQEQWVGAFKAIGKSFQDTVSGMQRTGGTFGDFMRGLVRDLVGAFLKGNLEMLASHAALWLAKKHITLEGVETEVALEAWAAIKSITMSAYKSAASAFSAIAGIPYIGPFLAPAAAAAALVGVLALAGGISSAAGGYDVPQGINPVTQLHANEMVLPSKYADVIRGLADGGGGSGGAGVNVHVYTMDAAGVHQWANKNKAIIGKAAMSYVDSGGAPRGAAGRRG